MNGSTSPGSKGRLSNGAKHSNMFPTPQWRDLWAAILFYAHFVVFIGISVYVFTEAGKLQIPPKETDNVEISLIRYAAITFSGAAFTAIGLTALVLMAMYKMPETMLHATLIANIALTATICIINFIAGSISGGIVFLVFALVSTIFYFVFRSRIPFSAIILRTVIDGLQAYPTMLIVSGGSVFVSLIYILYFAATVGSLGALHQYTEDDNATWMSIYSVFSLFWTSQVLSNTVQTTIAGVYATYYFVHGTGQIILNPVAQSLHRAVTYSFGSICLGSLIVAIIQTIRFLLRSVNNRDSIAGAIIDCILGLIQGLVEYFNYYAYTQIAIYGKPYIQAAKDTWSLIKSRGIDAIVNDNLIGTCTSIAALTIGIVSGIVAFLIALLIYGKTQEFSLVTAIVLGIVSLIIPFIAFEILTAGATTTFVCLAEDPASLQRTKPELYNAIMQRYSMITM